MTPHSVRPGLLVLLSLRPDPMSAAGMKVNEFSNILADAIHETEMLNSTILKRQSEEKGDVHGDSYVRSIVVPGEREG